MNFITLLFLKIIIFIISFHGLITKNSSFINRSQNKSYINKINICIEKILNNDLLRFISKIEFYNYSIKQINYLLYKQYDKFTKLIVDTQIIYNKNYNIKKKNHNNHYVYTVKKGDTLYYIAWVTNNNYHKLAQDNNLTKPYNLRIGQSIIINNNLKKINKIPKFIRSQKFSKYQLQSSYFDVNNFTTKINKWYWPTKGKIIEFFSDLQNGNQGLDIIGLRGQSIFATAAGKIVYSGHALRGYGNLIIIKHNNNYLSAYAHNDVVLVNTQEKVHAGQKIAFMGSSGTNLVKLHFEIRYKGKSMNPLNYLSKK